MPKKRKKTNVTISRGWLDHFKREAKRLFPKECYAIMLGSVDAKGNKKVEFMIYPDIMGNYSDTERVTICAEWWEHAHAVAELKGMTVIGDMHSHCYEGSAMKDIAPSMTDWDRLTHEYTQGICVINKGGNGSLRASVRFWEPGPDVMSEVTD